MKKRFFILLMLVLMCSCSMRAPSLGLTRDEKTGWDTFNDEKGLYQTFLSDCLYTYETRECKSGIAQKEGECQYFYRDGQLYEEYCGFFEEPKCFTYSLKNLIEKEKDLKDPAQGWWSCEEEPELLLYDSNGWHIYVYEESECNYFYNCRECESGICKKIAKCQRWYISSEALLREDGSEYWFFPPLREEQRGSLVDQVCTLSESMVCVVP
ncbi:MAG: hypothetical protein PHE21_00770 [Candidatus Dojkabacteria bacterium]|nr:hypothetical protein [Candidatus Dojkabacteria bacterium]